MGEQLYEKSATHRKIALLSERTDIVEFRKWSRPYKSETVTFEPCSSGLSFFLSFLAGEYPT